MKQFLATITLVFGLFIIPQSVLAYTTGSEALLIESTRWTIVASAKNPGEIRKYLEQYPDGTYAVDARQLLGDLEEKLWETANDSGTIHAYENFRTQFPNSDFVPIANQMINGLALFRLMYIPVFIFILILIDPSIISAVKKKIPTLIPDKGRSGTIPG